MGANGDDDAKRLLCSVRLTCGGEVELAQRRCEGFAIFQDINRPQCEALLLRRVINQREHLHSCQISVYLS